jgi:hypothetical protein
MKRLPASTVNSLTFDSSAESASAAQAAFDYIPPQGILAIGGLVSGVPLINPSDLDYRVLFDQFSTAPGFLFNLVSQLSAATRSDYDIGTGSIVATPESSTFVLLGSGLIGITSLVRRRFYP